MRLSLVVLSTVLSFLSACLSGYLAMAVVLGPWVAPVFVVVTMFLMLQVIDKQWFREYVVVGIAAGSIGSMVGTCVGSTWPSLYFLHEDMFTIWMKSPLKFAGTVSALVLTAGVFGFLITHFFRYHLIVEHELKFPMSHLIYKIIYETKKSAPVLMFHGLMVSTSWNLFTWIARVPLQAYLIQLQTVPVFVSLGFVAGQAIAIPLLMGMLSRIFSMIVIKYNFFPLLKNQDFILTFSSGMLLALMCVGLVSFIISLYQKSQDAGGSHFYLLARRALNNKPFLVSFLLCLASCSAMFFSWDISFLQQLYVLAAVFVLSGLVSIIVGRVGVVEVASFVSFIVLPFAYVSYTTSLSALVVVAFCTVCVGIVVDLFFSYKLAHLAKIPHNRILMYQLVGFFVAIVSIGLIIWWYIDVFSLGSSQLMAQNAFNQEAFITFGNYDYKVLAIGFVYALVLQRFTKELLVIIGGVMMPITMSFWLILAGALSYLVKDREVTYPFWFGLYATHSIWMVVRALVSSY